MRVLVLYAHPVETSFGAELHRTVVQSLVAAGHEVDDCDLYEEGFDPRLTREERLGYHEVGENEEGVQSYIDRLRAADGLVLCYPVWNFGFPAILKGFFDRIFLPGVSFKLVNGQVRPALQHVRYLAVVTTYGGTRFRARLMGDPPRKVAGRMLRTLIKPGAPFRYMAHYDMNRSTDRSRGRFLANVKSRLEAA